MLFNSFVFLLFLAFILPCFYALRGQRYKSSFLLVVSYCFYAYWDWRFCGLLAVSTICDFLIGRHMHAAKGHREKRALLFLSLLINLGILAFFKYFNFFIESFEAAFGVFGWQLDTLHLNVILPVGISFYTFQTLSYTFDIYRGRIKPTNSIRDFAVFVAFFPQLVAGPIERAANLLPQLSSLKAPSSQQVKEGVVLVITGLFLKVMVGDASGRIVDHVFAQPDYYSSLELVCALVLFSVQIYADFCGYSNIARGTGKLLGVELMQNFAQPYLSSNITEFWRRWHISLSSWLKDYLYIALGGNRRGVTRTYINLMLTMLLGGLWHGANWTFVIWGALHGGYLVIHKLLLQGRKPTLRFEYLGPTSLLSYLGKALCTYLLVLFAWLFFRAANWSDALHIMDLIGELTLGDYPTRFISITAAYIGLVLAIDITRERLDTEEFVWKLRNKALASGILAGMIMTTLVYMFVQKPLPFVYFQF